jgi:hypothetical protein
MKRWRNYKFLILLPCLNGLLSCDFFGGIRGDERMRKAIVDKVVYDVVDVVREMERETGL